MQQTVEDTPAEYLHHLLHFIYTVFERLIVC